MSGNGIMHCAWSFILYYVMNNVSGHTNCLIKSFAISDESLCSMAQFFILLFRGTRSAVQDCLDLPVHQGDVCDCCQPYFVVQRTFDEVMMSSLRVSPTATADVRGQADLSFVWFKQVELETNEYNYHHYEVLP